MTLKQGLQELLHAEAQGGTSTLQEEQGYTLEGQKALAGEIPRIFAMPADKLLGLQGLLHVIKNSSY